MLSSRVFFAALAVYFVASSEKMRKTANPLVLSKQAKPDQKYSTKKPKMVF